MFILTFQNFLPSASGGGEGECLKIIQVGNGSLSELVEVFLGMTLRLNMPAGAVVLLGSPSYVATTGTANYATKVFLALGQLRGAFTGDVNVLHGIPFLLGNA